MKRNIIISSVGSAVIALMAISAVFVIAEPAVSFGAGSTQFDQFTISQGVTAEVSFKTPATNVVMAPTIGGMTGGDATGTTQVVITTNDHLGYQMTIQASSSAGMVGNVNGGTIPAYVPSTPGVPDYNFTVPANGAYFGYTVEASTTADLTAFFKNNGTACNTGSSNGLGHCWLNATTTAFYLADTSSATAASGSTTTLKFHVRIMSNPSPTIPDDTYVATTTLTALVK